MKDIKDIFKKFAGDIVDLDQHDLDVSNRDFVYCLIQLPVAAYIHSKDKLKSLIAKIFEIAVEHNGDVNQFCCDTILILYGVPLRHEEMYSDLGKLIHGLTVIDQSLRIIIGHDQGLCGAFGFDKRKVATAIGLGMLNDYHTLGALTENKIHVHENVAKLIKNMPNSDRIQFV